MAILETVNHLSSMVLAENVIHIFLYCQAELRALESDIGAWT